MSILLESFSSSLWGSKWLFWGILHHKELWAASRSERGFQPTAVRNWSPLSDSCKELNSSNTNVASHTEGSVGINSMLPVPSWRMGASPRKTIVSVICSMWSADLDNTSLKIVLEFDKDRLNISQYYWCKMRFSFFFFLVSSTVPQYMIF